MRQRERTRLFRVTDVALRLLHFLQQHWHDFPSENLPKVTIARTISGTKSATCSFCATFGIQSASKNNRASHPAATDSRGMSHHAFTPAASQSTETVTSAPGVETRTVPSATLRTADTKRDSRCGTRSAGTTAGAGPPGCRTYCLGDSCHLTALGLSSFCNTYHDSPEIISPLNRTTCSLCTKAARWTELQPATAVI